MTPSVLLLVGFRRSRVAGKVERWCPSFSQRTRKDGGTVFWKWLSEGLLCAHSSGASGGGWMWKLGVLGEAAGSLDRDSGVDVDHVDHGIPVARELADLLRIHFEHERDFVVVPVGFGLHVRNVERTAGCSVEDAHQRALRVAVADREGMHGVAPGL